MGTKNRPGRFDCYDAAGLNEPQFTLLARDATAPTLVRWWAHMRDLRVAAGHKPKSDLAKVEEARRCADAMDAWRAAGCATPRVAPWARAFARLRRRAFGG